MKLMAANPIWISEELAAAVSLSSFHAAGFGTLMWIARQHRPGVIGTWRAF